MISGDELLMASDTSCPLYVVELHPDPGMS